MASAVQLASLHRHPRRCVDCPTHICCKYMHTHATTTTICLTINITCPGISYTKACANRLRYRLCRFHSFTHLTRTTRRVASLKTLKEIGQFSICLGYAVIKPRLCSTLSEAFRRPLHLAEVFRRHTTSLDVGRPLRSSSA